MRKPTLLDLFCCAGGAGVGYATAGFDVTGVDIAAQPRFPLTFIQADALTLSPEFLASFDVIHASPPCQSYSDLAKRNGNADAWPRLIEPVRAMLRATGKPYIIENVEGAPLIEPLVLCGTMFPTLRVIRHRLFESNVALHAPPHSKHPLVFTHDKRKSHYGKLDQDTAFVQVTGGGNCSIANAKAAMGINEWARRIRELRDEDGWPILTNHDRNELKPGQYILTGLPPDRPDVKFKRDISARLRAEVLDRNGFTCQMCGLTPGEIDPTTDRKVRLHVGHIIDKALGGKDEVTNLRALCSTCNQGAKNLTSEKPSAIWLLAQVRRASIADQRSVYEWLGRKFGSG